MMLKLMHKENKMAEAFGMALPQLLIFFFIDHFLRTKWSRKVRMIFALIFQASITTAIGLNNSTIEAAPSGVFLFAVIFGVAVIISLVLILFRPSKISSKK